MSSPYDSPLSKPEKVCDQCNGTGFKPPPPRFSEVVIEVLKLSMQLGILFLTVVLCIQSLKYWGVVKSVDKVKRVTVTEVTIGEYTWEID